MKAMIYKKTKRNTEFADFIAGRNPKQDRGALDHPRKIIYDSNKDVIPYDIFSKIWYIINNEL